MKTLLTQHPVNEQYQSNSGVNTVVTTILGIVEVDSYNEPKIIVDSEKLMAWLSLVWKRKKEDTN